MKKILEKLFGIDRVRAEAERSVAIAEEAAKAAKDALEAAEKAKEVEELAKLAPKERATRKKEPWVGVLETHVNKDNIRNGFFELDWNEHFILQLREAGYGTKDDPDEEIIDRWFRELCANVVVDGDYGGPVDTGVIDIQSVKRNNNL